MSEENVSITVTIGDRMYPLKIKGEDEPLLRKAEQIINHKYSEFQLKFSGQEKLDYLAMSALMNVVELMKLNDEAVNVSNDVKAKLRVADDLITDSLRR